MTGETSGLALEFLRDASARHGRTEPVITPSGLAQLTQHDWRGNLRELYEVIDRAVALCGGPHLGAAQLRLEPTPLAGVQEQGLQQLKTHYVVSFERNILIALLQACNGNINRAARTCNKDRRALFELVRKYDIDVQSFREGAAGA